MKNPFEYGGVVGGSAFCNRKKELSDLVRAMENSEKLFLYSERRLGKTSLIHYALSKLPKGQLRISLCRFVGYRWGGLICYRDC